MRLSVRPASMLLLALLALWALAQLAAAQSPTSFYGPPTVRPAAGRPVVLPAVSPPAAPAAPARAPQPLPKAPEVQPAAAAAAVPLPTGVSFEKLDDRERYSVAGVETDQQHCYAAIGAGGLVDDSKHPTVTVIDADENRRKVLVGQIKAGLQKVGLGDAAKFADGPPQDWWFRPGFATAGNPTVYCQAADGKTLHHQEGLAGGTDAAVEAVIEAVRKGRPDYRPERDPDLRRPDLIDFAKYCTADNVLGLVVLVVLGLILFEKARQPR